MPNSPLKMTKYFYLEANPRASRTAPFVSKAIGLTTSKTRRTSYVRDATIKEFKLTKEK